MHRNNPVSIGAESLRAGKLHGPGAFAAVCLGQMVSLCGSHLTSFVLGIWVYQQTRSATRFSLIAFCAIVPEILLGPIAGAMVDRWNRRWVLIAGNLGAALCTFSLIIFALTNQFAIHGRLAIWPIYIVVAASSAFQAVQFPAVSASTALWVPAPHLSRANALMELGNSIAMIVAPALAATLLGAIGFKGVFVIDVVTFVFAIGALFLSHFPSHQAASRNEIVRSSLLREALQGWHYVKGRRELLALLILFAFTNFATGAVQVLLPPLVLSFASPIALGTVMSFAGGGLVAGSLLVSVLGGPRHKVRAILLCSLGQGVVLFLGVFRPSVPLVAGAALLFSLCAPVIFACSQTIWQTEVEQEIQGRAFAIRRLVAWSSLPAAYLMSGPLADRICEPLMAVKGALAGTVGALIGTGAGRGIALLFIVLGLAIVAIVAISSRYRPFWKLEERLLAKVPKKQEEKNSRPVFV